jgi:selenocysteine-specific elongation factor
LKQIILGTAGHIDHGKTSLIKALTGTDTDRLKEEKERGITIELGFASLTLPSGQHLGIVDVPGHEKFVRNMVAGATGIDMVVMVIAADEGIMPQTREHMEICTLLSIRHGLIALTKNDLVDEEWREMVKEDIIHFVEGTFLENAPIIPLSSTTGEGLPDLLNALDEISSKIPAHQLSGLFRLPVDRVFSMKGFGTVITGSLVSGSINVGDTIMVYPSGVTSKIRGIQVHNQSVERAESGMRTAINFQGLDKASVNRGDVLALPGSLKSSYMIDIQLNFLKSNEKSMKNRTRVRFHSGTSEIMGNLILLDREELMPGESIVGQIRLDTPVTLVKDDRFVIRSYSPVRTIGGGHILNPIPVKHKRFREEIVSGLAGLADSDPADVIAFHVEQSGYAGALFSDLKLMTNLPEKPLQNAISTLLAGRVLVQIDKENRTFIHRDNIDSLVAEAIQQLKSYHEKNPLKAGMSKEELKSKLPSSMDGKLFTLLLNHMKKSDNIILEEDLVRLFSFTVSMKIDQEDVSRRILAVYQKDGLTPPYFKDLSETLNIQSSVAKDVLMLLVEQGKITKVKEDLFFSKQAIEDLKKRLVEFFKTKDELTTPEFKEIAGVSRKYLIPLIEYFDSKNVTIRVGDTRRLRNG